MRRKFQTGTPCHKCCWPLLYTALCEVEVIINDWSIMTMTNDPNNLKPLTPNHLLQLKTNPIMPRTVSERWPIFTENVEACPIPCWLVLEMMDQGLCSIIAGTAKVEWSEAEFRPWRSCCYHWWQCTRKLWLPGPIAETLPRIKRTSPWCLG